MERLLTDRIRARCLIGLIVAVVVVPVACGGGVHDAAGDPGGASSKIGSATPEGTELVAKLADPQTERDEVAAHEATQELIRACMAEAGFDFAVTPAELVVGARSPAPHAWQIETRLRPAPPAPSVDPEAANRDALASLDPSRRAEWEAAFSSGDDIDVPVLGYTTSVSSGGCLAEAHLQLYGPQAEWVRAQTVATNVDSQADQMVAADDEYLGTERDFIDCMAQRGVPLTGLQDLAADAGPDVSGAARACDESSSLSTTGDRLMASARGSFASDHVGDLRAYLELSARAADRAGSVLGR